MSGKRISREKLTIKKMIDLYQAKCPQASAEPEHYEALFAYAHSTYPRAAAPYPKNTYT